MKYEEITMLSQLIDSIELAYKKLETAFEKKDSENFDKAKKEIIRFHLQINEVLS